MCEICKGPLTRRSFLAGSATSATAFALTPGLLRGLAPERASASGHRIRAAGADRPWLELAAQAWSWLDAARIDTPHGATWPADPTDPTTTGDTLYTHGPGVIPFALELHYATGDERYLDAAAEGTAHLAATLDEVKGAGLYTGLAGIAFVLAEHWRASGRDADRATAETATARLIDRAVRAGDGIAWPRGSGADAVEVNDVIGGTAGTGLGLLHLARVLESERALVTAEEAGRRLLEHADPTDAGRRWEMWSGYRREMPNFSHGTAGIAYFLAALHQATGERDFLEAALDGARYLTAQAAVARSTGPGEPTGSYQLFHSRPGGETLYYLSWCHGPPGTNRLFQRLARSTGDDAWGNWVARGARGVMEAGIPERRTPGFWENVGQCCGTAGVAEHFLALHRATGRPDYRAFVDRLNDDLVSRSAATAGSGRKWTQAEHRVQPELLVAQTGFMQGAAGIGKYFLHMDAFVERGAGPRVLLPDDPAIAD